MREKNVVCIYDQKQCDNDIDCVGAEDEYYCDCKRDGIVMHTHVIYIDELLACRGVEDNGGVRLVDGHSIREGRLEICMNGRWRTVCDSGFDTADAVVACTQL